MRNAHMSTNPNRSSTTSASTGSNSTSTTTTATTTTAKAPASKVVGEGLEVDHRRKRRRIVATSAKPRRGPLPASM